MGWQVDLQTALNFILGLGVPIGAYYLKGVRDEVASVASELRRLNGRVVRIEEWRANYTALEKERHERNDRDIAELRARSGSAHIRESSK